jgi:hypothetical protein
MRHRIEGQLFEQIGKELALQPRTLGLSQSLRESASAGEGPGKAEAVTRYAVVAGTFEHQAADQIVHENVLPQLALDVRGILAAQLVHLQGDLEIAQAQFHFPSAQEEFGKRAERVAHAVEQGGDKDDFAGAESWLIDPATHKAQSQLRG